MGSEHSQSVNNDHSVVIFTFISVRTRTAEIIVRLLANICCRSISEQIHEFITYVIIYCKKKQIDVSFSCVCPVIDNEFRRIIPAILVLSKRY